MLNVDVPFTEDEVHQRFLICLHISDFCLCCSACSLPSVVTSFHTDWLTVCATAYPSLPLIVSRFVLCLIGTQTDTFRQLTEEDIRKLYPKAIAAYATLNKE
jgi:hypothetical protein